MKLTKITCNEIYRLSRFGLWLNFTSSIIFLTLISISHYYSIINGYDWTFWELSELVIYSFTSKILFSTACVISGFCFFLIFIPLYCYFYSKKHQLIFLVLSTITATSLIGIGAFPVDIFKTVHNIFGILFFTTTTILIFYLTLLLQLKYKYLPKWLYFFGYFTTSVLLFHVITRFFFGQAFTQRLAVLFSILYLLVFSWKMITTKTTNGNNQIVVVTGL